MIKTKIKSKTMITWTYFFILNSLQTKAQLFQEQSQDEQQISKLGGLHPIIPLNDNIFPTIFLTPHQTKEVIFDHYVHDQSNASYYLDGMKKVYSSNEYNAKISAPLDLSRPFQIEYLSSYNQTFKPIKSIALDAFTIGYLSNDNNKSALQFMQISPIDPFLIQNLIFGEGCEFKEMFFQDETVFRVEDLHCHDMIILENKDYIIDCDVLFGYTSEEVPFTKSESFKQAVFLIVRYNDYGCDPIYSQFYNLNDFSLQMLHCDKRQITFCPMNHFVFQYCPFSDKSFNGHSTIDGYSNGIQEKGNEILVFELVTNESNFLINFIYIIDNEALNIQQALQLQQFLHHPIVPRQYILIDYKQGIYLLTIKDYKVYQFQTIVLQDNEETLYLKATIYVSSQNLNEQDVYKCSLFLGSSMYIQEIKLQNDPTYYQKGKRYDFIHKNFTIHDLIITEDFVMVISQYEQTEETYADQNYQYIFDRLSNFTTNIFMRPIDIRRYKFFGIGQYLQMGNFIIQFDEEAQNITVTILRKYLISLSMVTQAPISTSKTIALNITIIKDNGFEQTNQSTTMQIMMIPFQWDQIFDFSNNQMVFSFSRPQFSIPLQQIADGPAVSYTYISNKNNIPLNIKTDYITQQTAQLNSHSRFLSQMRILYAEINDNLLNIIFWQYNENLKNGQFFIYTCNINDVFSVSHHSLSGCTTHFNFTINIKNQKVLSIQSLFQNTNNDNDGAFKGFMVVQIQGTNPNQKYLYWVDLHNKVYDQIAIDGNATGTLPFSIIKLNTEFQLFGVGPDQQSIYIYQMHLTSHLNAAQTKLKIGLNLTLLKHINANIWSMQQDTIQDIDISFIDSGVLCVQLPTFVILLNFFIMDYKCGKPVYEVVMSSQITLQKSCQTSNCYMMPIFSMLHQQNKILIFHEQDGQQHIDEYLIVTPFYVRSTRKYFLFNYTLDNTQKPLSDGQLVYIHATNINQNRKVKSHLLIFNTDKDINSILSEIIPKKNNQHWNLVSHRILNYSFFLMMSPVQNADEFIFNIFNRYPEFTGKLECSQSSALCDTKTQMLDFEVSVSFTNKFSNVNLISTVRLHLDLANYNMFLNPDIPNQYKTIVMESDETQYIFRDVQLFHGPIENYSLSVVKNGTSKQQAQGVTVKLVDIAEENIIFASYETSLFGFGPVVHLMRKNDLIIVLSVYSLNIYNASDMPTMLFQMNMTNQSIDITKSYTILHQSDKNIFLIFCLQNVGAPIIVFSYNITASPNGQWSNIRVTQLQSIQMPQNVLVDNVDSVDNFIFMQSRLQDTLNQTVFTVVQFPYSNIPPSEYVPYNSMSDNLELNITAVIRAESINDYNFVDVLDFELIELIEDDSLIQKDYCRIAMFILSQGNIITIIADYRNDSMTNIQNNTQNTFSYNPFSINYNPEFADKFIYQKNMTPSGKSGYNLTVPFLIGNSQILEKLIIKIEYNPSNENGNTCTFFIRRANLAFGEYSQCFNLRVPPLTFGQTFLARQCSFSDTLYEQRMLFILIYINDPNVEISRPVRIIKTLFTPHQKCHLLFYSDTQNRVHLLKSSHTSYLIDYFVNQNIGVNIFKAGDFDANYQHQEEDVLLTLQLSAYNSFKNFPAIFNFEVAIQHPNAGQPRIWIYALFACISFVVTIGAVYLIVRKVKHKRAIKSQNKKIATQQQLIPILRQKQTDRSSGKSKSAKKYKYEGINRSSNQSSFLNQGSTGGSDTYQNVNRKAFL